MARGVYEGASKVPRCRIGRHELNEYRSCPPPAPRALTSPQKGLWRAERQKSSKGCRAPPRPLPLPGRRGLPPPPRNAMGKRARKSGAAPAPAPAPALSGSAQLEARVARLVAAAKRKEKELAKITDELALARNQLRRERGIEAAGSSWRDWGGLPGNVLKTLAGVISRTCDADYRARIKPYRGNLIRYSNVDDGTVEWRPPPPPEGSANGLLIFSLVCRAWREGQVDLGTLRTRVSDILVHDKLEILKLVLDGKNPIPKRFNPPFYSGLFPTVEKDLAQLAASCGALEILKFMHFKVGWSSRGLACRGCWGLTAALAGRPGLEDAQGQLPEQLLRLPGGANRRDRVDGRTAEGGEPGSAGVLVLHRRRVVEG